VEALEANSDGVTLRLSGDTVRADAAVLATTASRRQPYMAAAWIGSDGN